MKIIKLAVLSAFLSVAMSRAHADQTNVVQNIGIHLFGVQPGGTVTTRSTVTKDVAPVRIDTRQVIEALGAATGIAFRNSARLVAVTPLGGGYSQIQVRDRNNTVDVTSFFSHDQLTDSVSGSVSNTVTHRTTLFDYNIQRFALNDAIGLPALSVHFDVNGFAAGRSSGNLPGVSNSEIDVNGSGDLNGSLLILHGTIEVEGDRLEAVPDGGGGGGNT